MIYKFLIPDEHCTSVYIHDAIRTMKGDGVSEIIQELSTDELQTLQDLDHAWIFNFILATDAEINELRRSVIENLGG